MGEDWGHAGELELVDGFAHAAGDGEVGQLDEEVVLLVDGVAGGVGVGVLDVVEAEVEVAAGAEDEGDGFGGEGGAEFGDSFGVDGGVEGPVGAGVWRADDVGDAVARGHAGHGDGSIEVG